MLKFIIPIFLFASYFSFAQCISGDCEKGTGAYKFQDGSKYEGEFADSKPNGKGKLAFPNGDYYEGEFKDNYCEGAGTRFVSKDNTFIICKWEKNNIKDGDVTIKKGDKLVFQGKMKNGMQNGFGKYCFDNDCVYEGDFIDNEMSGNGAFTYPDKSKYIGPFKKNMKEGKGIEYYSNGDRFEGAFENDKKNGSGVMYLSKGGKVIGIWKDDEYISGSKENSDSSKAGIEIKLSKTESGLYELSANINNSLDLPFILETGSPETFLSAETAKSLFKANNIKKEDIVQGETIADTQGKINLSARFIIKELKINGITLNNIMAGVASGNANILGQNVLSQFGKILIDNNKKTLTISK